MGCEMSLEWKEGRGGRKGWSRGFRRTESRVTWKIRKRWSQLLPLHRVRAQDRWLWGCRLLARHGGSSGMSPALGGDTEMGHVFNIQHFKAGHFIFAMLRV